VIHVNGQDRPAPSTGAIILRFHSRYSKPLYPAARSFIQAGVLAALSALPAGALIVQAGKDERETQARIARAHEEGKRYKSVVGIRVNTGPTGSGIASGVYIGASPDGQTGFVLTVAHSFFTGKRLTRTPKNLKAVTLIFGPRIPDLAAEPAPDLIEVPVGRVPVPPEHLRTGPGQPALDPGGDVRQGGFPMVADARVSSASRC